MQDDLLLNFPCIQQNVSLAQFTTYKIGTVAEYLYMANSVDELKRLLEYSNKHNIHVRFLGGGSNVLFHGETLNGIMIMSKFDSISQSEERDTILTVGSAVNVQTLISFGLTNNLTGLEFAAGIPGSLGGAIRGNAGTFGVDCSSIVTSVTTIDIAGKIHRFSNNDCMFSYRNSIFKTLSHFIINSEIMLCRGNVSDSKNLITQRLHTRYQNHPLEPSSGCIFKNIPFHTIQPEKLKALGLDIDRFSKHKKLPSGYIIESLGLSGTYIGDAKISEKHANYFVNLGKATSQNILDLISLAKKKAKDTYDIDLEEEVQIICN